LTELRRPVTGAGKPADDLLSYLDQGSFLGLRALGRQPVIQYIWIYNRGVDLDGLRRFQRNLRHTLLGRVIERSSVPGGRHRWVAWTGPDDIDISPDECRREDVWDWVWRRAYVPVDPETGPPWHLGVQPLVGGGDAVTLVVSHTTADAGALITSIVEAVEGPHVDRGYLPPNGRSRAKAIRQDAGAALRCLAKVPAAISGAVRIAKQQKDELSGAARSSARRGSDAQQPVDAAAAIVTVAIEDWEKVAKGLGGTSNALLAGIGARLGAILGRVDDDGKAMLSLPVSLRRPGDHRGNALSTITVTADPATVTEDLAPLRADIKKALTSLEEDTAALMAPLPLIPFTPAFLLRRLEKAVLKFGLPIGCSNAGEMPAAANRPDGTEADYFASRLAEPGITAADYDRMNGHLLFAVGYLNGHVCMTVASWVVGGVNTNAALRRSVRQALDDFGLVAEIE